MNYSDIFSDEITAVRIATALSAAASMLSRLMISRRS